MTSKQWQLANDAAQRYQDIAVPAFLGVFAQSLVDYADVKTSQVVIDVGCGTGAATRYAAQQMKPSSMVIGIDVNASMLAVAQSLPEVQGASIKWQQNNADDLSLDADSVDAVLSAQVIQFIPDRTKALNEMHRVLKSGQSVYLSIWCAIEQNPYLDALANALAKHISPDTAAGLSSAFSLSHADMIKDMFQKTPFSDIKTDIVEFHVPLPPMTEFVPQHLSATPMGASFQASPKDTQQAILNEMTDTLSEHQTDSGLEIPFCSHLIAAQK